MLKYTNIPIRVYTFSFLLPILFMGFIFSFFQAYPAGVSTVMKLDLDHQYIHFYSYLYDAIKGKDALLYNWYAGLGSNNIGNIAYYTSSPFLFIILLWDHYYLSESVLVLILLKVGLMGLSMAFFIKTKGINLSGSEVVFFSSFYALMSYTAVYFHNVMWLDILIWLPVLVILTERLVHNGFMSLFLIVLFVVFISNFYMAYMLGGFIFIYFLTEVIFKQKNKSREAKTRVGLKFALATIIAAGMAAFLLIPAAIQLSAAEISQPHFEKTINTEVLYVFLKLLSGVYDSVLEGSPQVYIGSFIWFLLPVFFLSKQISKIEKVRWSTLAVVLYVSMLIPHLDYIWHGFASPNSLLYRQSFILSFILLYMCIKAYENIKTFDYRYFFVFYLIANVIVVLCYFNFDEFTTTHLVINLCALALYLIFLLTKLRKPSWSVIRLTCIILFTLTELIFNTGSIYYQMTKDIGGLLKETYTEYRDYRKVIHKVNQHDDAFFRAKTRMENTLNDGIHMNYSSLNYFSSMVNHDLSRSLEALGLSANKAIYSQYGATLFTESLLAVKYDVGPESISRPGYEKVWEEDGLVIHENQYVLPLGFVTDSGLQDIHIFETDNLFQVQNNLLSFFAGYESEVFQRVASFNREIKNAVVHENGEIIQRNDDNEPVRINYSFNIDEHKQVFINLDTSVLKDTQIRINQLLISEYPINKNHSILKLGTFDQGTIKVEWVVDKDEFEITREQFYAANPETYEEVMAAIEP
ncbi:YfhO family protein, partial [Caldalkalibacillus salinus]|uniref:YfhO family protein n=1 Tax=Caldalkalibacillus salinus TaxID=2803787 RepID=UPI001920C50C